MENITGINEQKIDKLVLDIYAYADRVKQILGEVERIVENTSSVYKTDSASEFISDFNLNKQKFDTIAKIILSYSEDMINVKANYKKRTTSVSEELLRQHTTK